MDSYNTPGTPGNARNAIKGFTGKLKVYVVIPIVYAIILITVFIITHL